MDKKTLVIIFSLSLILIVSLSFVSAGLFSNLWGKITGKVIAPPATECLTANTQIHMADGSYKPVEDIAVGDVVLGKNGPNTVISLYNLILGKQNLYSFNGGRAFVTRAHPFMTTEGWKAIDPVYAKKWNPNLKIGQLSVGDKLITENSQILLESIEAHEAPYFTKIYNFAVDGDKTYYADGYLVHNKECPTACPSYYECGKYFPEDSSCPPLTCGFCSSGEVCQDGICIAPTCTDTDNGIVSSTYGICNDEQGSHYDSCYEGQINLKEYYCSNGACSYTVVACPGGTYCSSGECVQYSTSSTCTDTDKNATYLKGKNYYKKGKLGTKSDFCSGNILKEYFCSSGTNQRTKETYYYTNSTTYDCSSEEKICQGGACVSPPCGDGKCDSSIGENCNTCIKDCSCSQDQICSPEGVCIQQVAPSTCGNGKMDSGETCSSCPSDFKCKSTEACIEGICKVDLTPRIAYWYGKVNQHTENGVWKTDPDGSGANLDKLTYCKKWYPDTIKVDKYHMETITDWRDSLNRGPYISTQQSYKCISPSALTCSDTDGGINISVAGVVAYDSASYPDACINSTALNETVCFGFTLTNQKPNWVTINCPQGEVCDKGACVAANPSTLTCKDPDKTNEVGLVKSSYIRTTLVDKNGVSKTDYCQNSKEHEYSCGSDGTYKENIVPCTYGCSDQVCNKPESCEYYNDVLSTNAKYKFYMDFKRGEVFEAGPLKEIKAQCNVNFKSRILKSLPLNYNFSIPGMRIIKILNISADKETSALLNFTLNKSEIKYSPDIIKFYTWDKSHSKWTNLTRGAPVSTQDEYNFNVEVPHFSLFVIAEPELCGNGVFDSAYEQCDNTSNCNSSCMCEEGFTPDGEGNCTTSIVSTACSPINATNCSGHNYVKCNDSSVWQDEGVVVGKCGVECLSGDSSCDGDYSLFCGTNYKWSLAGKIVGKCNYTSKAANLGYPSNGNYLDNGKSNGESNTENGGTTSNNLSDKRNLIIFIIIVSLLAILVLFLLFKKLSKDNKRYSHRPGTPMRRTVSRTPPSRPGFRTATPRRPVRRIYYPK